MDLSSGWNIPKICQAIIEASSVLIETAEYCSMCGLKFCPMPNFREVDWSALKRAAEKLPVES